MILARANLRKAPGSDADHSSAFAAAIEAGRNFTLNYTRDLVLRNFQIVPGLKIQPEAGAGVEVSSESQSSIWGNAAALVDNLGNSRHRDAQIRAPADSC